MTRVSPRQSLQWHSSGEIRNGTLLAFERRRKALARGMTGALFLLFFTLLRLGRIQRCFFSFRQGRLPLNLALRDARFEFEQCELAGGQFFRTGPKNFYLKQTCQLAQKRVLPDKPLLTRQECFLPRTELRHDACKGARIRSWRTFARYLAGADSCAFFLDSTNLDSFSSMD